MACPIHRAAINVRSCPSDDRMQTYRPISLLFCYSQDVVTILLAKETFDIQILPDTVKPSNRSLFSTEKLTNAESGLV